MVRYFYAWTPLLTVGTICILSLPWLGLIALMIVLLVVLPACALAIVSVPYLLGRTITRRWHGRGEAVRRATAPLHVHEQMQPAFRERAVS
jgi:Flp pilus assembly pilin Flp